jgi:hypothetical protein
MRLPDIGGAIVVDSASSTDRTRETVAGFPSALRARSPGLDRPQPALCETSAEWVALSTTTQSRILAVAGIGGISRIRGICGDG